jgi:hypothetical protein
LGDGGGAYKLSSHDANIVSNLFLENEAADHGGAIYVARSSGSPEQVRILKNVLIANMARGVGGNSDCSGGAIFMAIAGALVEQNTIAFNHAYASAMDGAGGICLYDTYPGVLVERNILFQNYEGAIRTFTRFTPPRGTIRRNLIFDNGQADIKLSEPSELTLEENLFTDPLFCSLSRFDSRGELNHLSPALHSPYGVIGAVDEGSCGDRICCVDVIPITWGRLKALYSGQTQDHQ